MSSDGGGHLALIIGSTGHVFYLKRTIMDDFVTCYVAPTTSAGRVAGLATRVKND